MAPLFGGAPYLDKKIKLFSYQWPRILFHGPLKIKSKKITVKGITSF
jgi:hypothetical protein